MHDISHLGCLRPFLFCLGMTIDLLSPVQRSPSPRLLPSPQDRSLLGVLASGPWWSWAATLCVSCSRLALTNMYTGISTALSVGIAHKCSLAKTAGVAEVNSFLTARKTVRVTVCEDASAQPSDEERPWNFSPGRSGPLQEKDAKNSCRGDSNESMI